MECRRRAAERNPLNASVVVSFSLYFCVVCLPTSSVRFLGAEAEVTLSLMTSVRVCVCVCVCVC
jgi:hypothetical protein